MKRATFLISNAIASGAALADKYGIDESISESTGDLSDMVWGGVLIAGVIWLWKKIFG